MPLPRSGKVTIFITLTSQEIKTAADYEISVSRDLLPGLLHGPEGLAKLVEVILNQVLEAQLTEPLGAGRHERTAERPGDRMGSVPGFSSPVWDR